MGPVIPGRGGSMKTRILLVDDHTLFREGLAALLASADDLEVVGHAVDARAALRENERLRPDVVALDISLPGSNGLAIVRDLRRHRPELQVLMLTMHTLPEHVARALEAGATGYAVKDQPLEELLSAVRSVAR